MRASGGEPISIGAVVIGRNEGERLIACLRSTMRDVGLCVYVDSGSSDGSVAAASEMGAVVVNLDLTKPFTAARARNEGFARLRELAPDVQLVQFIDGDCELDDRWLKAAQAFLAQHPDVGLVCGRRRERYPEKSIYNRLCDMEWDTPVGQALQSGGDFLIRADAFQQVGGFSAQLIAGEEPELCARLRAAGWKIWRLDAEMTRHDANILRFGQWWRRMVRSGHAFAEVSYLHRHTPEGLWKRNVTSAIVWGGAVPLMIAATAIVYPWAILAAGIYPLQALRIALRGAHKGVDGVFYGAFVMIGKFAEMAGVATFYKSLSLGRAHPLIEYK